MSDSGKSGNAAGAGEPAKSAPVFTERELSLLQFAMQSLKAPPEVDYDKLAEKAGMTNPRSAANAWAKIKAKLFNADDLPATPKKGGKKAAATPKGKKANGKGDVDDDADGDAAGGSPTPTPKKKATPRKRAAKKEEVDGEQSSPKKRGRPSKAKKEEPVEDEEEDNIKVKVKTEDNGDSQDATITGDDTVDDDAELA